MIELEAVFPIDKLRNRARATPPVPVHLTFLHSPLVGVHVPHYTHALCDGIRTSVFHFNTEVSINQDHLLCAVYLLY